MQTQSLSTARTEPPVGSCAGKLFTWTSLSIHCLRFEVCSKLHLPSVTILQELLLVIQELLRTFHVKWITGPGRQVTIQDVACSSSASPWTIPKEERTSRDSVENSKFGPSTIASTGQASWQKPQYMHLVMSMSYLQPVFQRSETAKDRGVRRQ